MLHILTVVGARPQFIKAAALSRAVRNHFADKIRETIVHTGQHYDENMSQVFFDELEIPSPDYNLNVGSGSHNRQIAAMLVGLDDVLQKEKPDGVVVYGDTNSTLAGALAAVKLSIPVAHIEAGMRSFDMTMPEEINRVLSDDLSTLLFTPTKTGFENLQKAGLANGFKTEDGVATLHPQVKSPNAYLCGDIMYDNALYYAQSAEKKSDILQHEQLTPERYFLATIHRHFNTDHLPRLERNFEKLQLIAAQHNMPVVIPLHPRTRKQLEHLPELEKKLLNDKNVRLLPPASFFDMIVLEKNARLVLTDSGGVQKEAFFYKKPCVILRPSTEWVELVECGAAIMAYPSLDKNGNEIESAVATLLNRTIDFPGIFGDGHAAEFICRHLGELKTR